LAKSVHKFVNNFLPTSICNKLIKLASSNGKNSLPNNGYFKEDNPQENIYGYRAISGERDHEAKQNRAQILAQSLLQPFLSLKYLKQKLGDDHALVKVIDYGGYRPRSIFINVCAPGSQLSEHQDDTGAGSLVVSLTGDGENNCLRIKVPDDDVNRTKKRDVICALRNAGDAVFFEAFIDHESITPQHIDEQRYSLVVFF